VKIGATKSEGGSRRYSITVGGANTLPFYTFEGLNPPPVLALEVYDYLNQHPTLAKFLSDVVMDPVEWVRIVDKFNPDIINLNVRSISPLTLNREVKNALRLVEDVLQATDRPIMVTGIMDPIHSEDLSRNTEFLKLVAESFKGERLLIGPVTSEAYETVAEAALINDHVLLAKTNMDVNQAIRFNELLSSKGIPTDRIVMDVTTGALGYGVEYTLSTMERLRLRALQGDRMAGSPMVFFASENVFIVEFKEDSSKLPLYETTAAVAGLMSGADMVSLFYVESLNMIRSFLREFPWGGDGNL
jgi:acetyl-CoA decarbonylase/synthase complex subunit delta